MSKAPRARTSRSGRQQARAAARAAERVAERERARRRAARRRWRSGWRLGVVALGVLVVLAGAAVGLRAATGGPSSKSAATNSSSSGGLPPIDGLAPNLEFTGTDGTAQTVSSLHGRPTLLWLVATWCSSCIAGTQYMAQQGISNLQGLGVHVVELELSDDLGQAGPGIDQFGRQLAGARFTSADWSWGTASQAMTERYDPKGYLDIYYLLDPNGFVRYVNSSPASTFSALLGATAEASTMTLPAPPLLASTAGEANGQSVDGISCLGNEQVAFHHHSHLAVYVNGQPRTIPDGIGISPPQTVQQSPEGPFVTGGSCFYFLHTHTEDGIIHVESPTQQAYTLGEFFDEWHQPLGPNQVGPAQGQVFAFLNGSPWTGNPRDIPVSTEHNVIQLDVGTDTPAPQPFVFPPGY